MMRPSTTHHVSVSVTRYSSGRVTVRKVRMDRATRRTLSEVLVDWPPDAFPPGDDLDCIVAGIAELRLRAEERLTLF